MHQKRQEKWARVQGGGSPLGMSAALCSRLLLCPPLQGLCFLVFLLLTASISAYMGAALLEVLVTLAFLGLRATRYYERLTRVNWPCLVRRALLSSPLFAVSCTP